MSSFILKIIGIILMSIDHIGFIFFPQYKILRVIGRLAYPIFAFQIGVGFKHTRSKEKYILRMLLFTLISQIPFMLMLKNCDFMINIGGTFLIALLALYWFENIDNKYLKYIFLFIIPLLALVVPVDYGLYGVLTVIFFYLFYDKKLELSLSYYILTVVHCAINMTFFSLPSLLALPIILLYNGKKGPNVKYLFYLFYPLHMLLLVWVYSLI